ncbi:response regulator [Paenibacillus sp. UKAQ_18]|nr:response regulator [Paenibacillus sp. UKAQ_18]
MNIFILEDQFIQQRIMEKMVRKSCEELGICCSNLIVTSKPDLLLFESKACANNLYFLDIEISGCQMKGLEVAQEIRKYDMYGHIVFVTTHGHLSPLTFQYKVAALDFIIKDATQDEMEKKSEKFLLLPIKESLCWMSTIGLYSTINLRNFKFPSPAFITLKQPVFPTKSVWFPKTELLSFTAT